MFVARTEPCGQPRGQAHLPLTMPARASAGLINSDMTKPRFTVGAATTLYKVLRHTGPFGLGGL